MTDEIELLRAAKPDVTGPSPELARHLKGELMTEIEATRTIRRTRRKRRAVAAGALTPVAAAVVAALTLFGGGNEDAWASAVEVARAAPRLVVGESGWTITRADEFSVDGGEMTFSRGDRQLDLHWSSGRDFAFAVEKRAVELDRLGTAAVAGDTAHVFRYPGTNDYTAVWLRDGQTIEARGLSPSTPAFRETIGSLRKVGVDAWLAAMPDSVVRPASRAEVVDEMLEGIPLPSGFDQSRLRQGDAIRDRYQLGAQVSGAVACAWIDRWVAARRAGDTAGVHDAARAMQSAHGWPILVEMDEDGDYPEVLWELAAAMATNAPVSGGRPLSIEESYGPALGCPSS